MQQKKMPFEMVNGAGTVPRWSQEYFHEIYFRQAGRERSSVTRGESTVI
jgi:hypothetical protein